MGAQMLPIGRWQQLLCILSRSDYRPVALFMAIQMVALGLWLLNPWADTFASSRTYDGMSMIPEPVWGLWFTALGLALLWYTCLSHDHMGRTLACLATAVTWFTVTAAFAYANPVVLGVVIFAVNSLTASWLYFRTRVPRHD